MGAEMSGQHAPGPWRAYRSVIQDANGNSIASGGNNRMVVGEELAASLTLAAAAPDLVAALKAMKRCPGVGQTDQETGETFQTIIDLAIAKTTGGQL